MEKKEWADFYVFNRILQIKINTNSWAKSNWGLALFLFQNLFNPLSICNNRTQFRNKNCVFLMYRARSWSNAFKQNQISRINLEEVVSFVLKVTL